MELKVAIWLTNYGIEAVAKGQELDRWHFAITDDDTEMGQQGWHKVGESVVVAGKLPSRRMAIAFAVEKLNSQLREEEKKFKEKADVIKGAIESLRALPFDGGDK